MPRLCLKPAPPSPPDRTPNSQKSPRPPPWASHQTTPNSRLLQSRKNWPHPSTRLRQVAPSGRDKYAPSSLASECQLRRSTVQRFRATSPVSVQIPRKVLILRLLALEPFEKESCLSMNGNRGPCRWCDMPIFHQNGSRRIGHLSPPQFRRPRGSRLYPEPRHKGVLDRRQNTATLSHQDQTRVSRRGWTLG